MDEGVKRRYLSPRRAAQAAETRRAILASAYHLFLDRGYAATSIRAIATAAHVSDQTVYTTFGDKPSLLFEVGVAVLSGELGAESPDTRDYVAEILAEDDVDRRLALAAAWERSVWERGMLRFESMLLDAAATDSRAAEVAAAAWKQKYEQNRELFAAIFPPAWRNPGDDFDELYDLFFALDSAAFVRILVEDRGWSFDDFERWFAEMLRRVFVRPSPTDPGDVR